MRAVGLRQHLIWIGESLGVGLFATLLIVMMEKNSFSPYSQFGLALICGAISVTMWRSKATGQDLARSIMCALTFGFFTLCYLIFGIAYS